MANGNFGRRVLTSQGLTLELLKFLNRYSYSILHQPWRFSAGEVSFFGFGGKDSGKRSGSAGEKKLSRLRKFWTSIHDPSH